MEEGWRERWRGRWRDRGGSPCRFSLSASQLQLTDQSSRPPPSHHHNISHYIAKERERERERERESCSCSLNLISASPAGQQCETVRLPFIKNKGFCMNESRGSATLSLHRKEREKDRQRGIKRWHIWLVVCFLNNGVNIMWGTERRGISDRGRGAISLETKESERIIKVICI